MIPYGRQSIDENDIQAVIDVLRSDWLTTGPQVERFEAEFAEYVNSEHAVAVSSGTAALHASMFALNIKPGDQVIVPPITFAATANCVAYLGGTPVFADVEPETLLIDPDAVQKKISSKTVAIVGVDYAGHPCDWTSLRKIADRHHLVLVDDGCHALGAEYKGRKIGSIADLTVFSFHPVKHITTGEGGLITTSDAEFDKRLRLFRNHGIDSDHREREKLGSWYYEMKDLGYNYRLTDFQCALGISQLKKIDRFVKRRMEIAEMYNSAISNHPKIQPLATRTNVKHVYHLFVVKVFQDRKSVFESMRKMEIGVNVHYIPVYWHPYYRKRFGTGNGLCPIAETCYEQILSLPIYPEMKDRDVEQVISALKEALE